MDIKQVISDFISILLQLFIAGSVPALAVVAYKLIQSLYQRAALSLTAEQMGELRNLVVIVVTAAEQSGLAGLIEDAAKAKKQYAIDTLQAIVDAHGWKISIEQIDAEIENAVRLGVHEIQGDEKQSAIGFAMGDAESDEDTPANFGFLPH